MAITSKIDLIEHCKRKLGSPVINLELDDDQVEDRVDDAIQFYQDIHYDGTERVYLKHQIVGTAISVSSVVGLIKGESVVCANGATFVIASINNMNNSIIVDYIDGNVPPANTQCESQQSGISFTIISVSLGDIDKGFITVPDAIIGIAKIVPFKNSVSNNNYLDYAFDPRYQIQVTELYNISSASITYYSMVQQHLSMLDYELRALDTLTFNRRTGRVYLGQDLRRLKTDEYLIFEAFQAVNPESFVDMYNDRLFKDYATAKIKLQWGNNLKKFEGVQMIGGITLNGQQIYQEAVEEIAQLEEKIRAGFELPPMGFIG